MVATLLVAVLAVAAGAGATVEFIHQSVDTAANEATFFYTVTSDGQPDVDQVILAVSSCLTMTDAGTWTDGFVTQSGGGASLVGCDPNNGVCGAIFNEGIAGAGTVAKYYFTIDLGPDGVSGISTSPTGTLTVITSDGQVQKPKTTGPICKPTAVKLSSMNAVAASIPVAALGGLALAGLGALAALRRRSA
jgi:hypothetical protein